MDSAFEVERYAMGQFGVQWGRVGCHRTDGPNGTSGLRLKKRWEAVKFGKSGMGSKS